MGKRILELSLLTRLVEGNYDSQNIKLNALMLPCSDALGKEKAEKYVKGNLR